MFPILALNKKEDYFKDIQTRPQKGVYFTRFIGYDDEGDFISFLHAMKEKAEQNGIFLDRAISNPTNEETEQLYRVIGTSYHFELHSIEQNIRLWMGSLKPFQVTCVAEAIHQLLEELRQQHINDNILKNAYVKFMCWIHNIFGVILKRTGENPPIVLYIGDISKYEVYMLSILARSGCDIVYVNFLSDESYLKIDKASHYSQAVVGSIKKPISISSIVGNRAESVSNSVGQNPIKPSQPALQGGPSPSSAKAGDPKHQLRSMIEGMGSAIHTNDWLNGFFEDFLLKPNSERSQSPKPEIFNFFAVLLGVDKNLDEYRNRLYHIKEKLTGSKKNWVLIDKKILNPTFEETQPFKQIAYTGANRENLLIELAENISLRDDKILTLLAQRAFLHVMDLQPESNSGRLYNQSVRLLCWLNRYTNQLYDGYEFEHQPAVVYYGSISSQELLFLELLSQMGVDVLYIQPNKAEKDVLLQNEQFIHAKLYELEETHEIFPFPQREVKVRVATAAYQASRELDEVLYNDTGLYRRRQFTRVQPVTLQTTYEEIAILWKQEAKYRPSFETRDNLVITPNIFAKVDGVKDGDINAYWNFIRGLMTNQTILVTSVPFIHLDIANPMVENSLQFVKDGQVQFDNIKRAKGYPYDYLSEDLQDTILEKLQELIDLGWIISEGTDPAPLIAATVLSLDRYVLRLMQNFDYVGQLPKLIIVDVQEKMFRLEDCIFIAYLNLIGFDIVIFTPTGYRNIEKYIQPVAFERYDIGQFLYNLQIPDLRSGSALDGSVGSILNRIFKKGRNS